jgi:CDP-diacylglycerol pyrophosphatase
MTPLTIIVALLLLVSAPAHAADADALWKIVHDGCVPAEEAHGEPQFPCLLVELSAGIDNGYVVMKDREGATQLLVLPTAKITGIESPMILAPDSTNYLAMAWLTVPTVEALAHRSLPRDGLSLAVNSMTGRSQNQLHIHVDCLDAGVRDALRQHLAEIGEHWAPLSVKLQGHDYLAMRVAGAWLEGKNPFRLLADGVPGAATDMGHQTLAVVGARLPDGHPAFILLAGHADPAAGNSGSAEELQDHACHGY